MSVSDMGVLAVEEGEVSDFGIQNIMGDRAAASIVLALNLVLLVLMLSTLWNKRLHRHIWETNHLTLSPFTLTEVILLVGSEMPT